ncbi:hypothetical protein [Streptomyces gilvus]|uniref:hypothetical protein n=1 Tax=Streptomyces gilvus TaxID=2920937 RepID=UPI001F1030BB|nr:hypothetical protein [Streptomyces sp. CME 23]MCH5677300.1 hypothetical protein [Streptomyces sp. CME 23]
MTQQHHTPSPTAARARNRRAVISALLTLAAITTGAGCSSSDGNKTDTSPTPSTVAPTTTVSAEEEQARKAVVAAYKGMTNERVKAYARSSLAGSQITSYATGKALRDVKNTVFVNMRNGIVFKGEPKVTAHEDDVALKSANKPSRASLLVCFDTNTWDPINKKTGKSVAVPNQVKRYTITADLQRVGSRWLVIEQDANLEKTC